MPNEGHQSRALAAPMQVSHSGFPQQGQVDWTALGKTTIEFTVNTIARISKAGVEALTIYAAGSIFHQVKLDALGEQRMNDAIKHVRAFASYNNALWFGFGVKHIIRSLSESSQGLALIGICACMTEEFSAGTSAKILRELFILYNPPSELSPSLRQWLALVEACEGTVARTNFGLISSELARICLFDGRSNIRTSAAPEDIAKVLKGLFDVSNGTTEGVYIRGEADCAWLAAVAHWLLGLSVAIQDHQGNIAFRTSTLKANTRQTPQVVIQYGTSETETSVLVQRSYIVPSGRLLLLNSHTPEEDVVAHGRVDWATCLCDTFGKPMKRLLSAFGPQSGACIGAVARIYEHLTCDVESTALLRDVRQTWVRSAATGSYGRGFRLVAQANFPELCNSPSLWSTMESILEKSPEAAVAELRVSITSIRKLCECTTCSGNSVAQNELNESEQPETFCLVFLLVTICSLIQLLSHVVFPKDLPLNPTRTGIERIYWDLRNRVKISTNSLHKPLFNTHQVSGYTVTLSNENMDNVYLAFFLDLPNTFSKIREVFTGRGNSRDRDQYNPSATAADGICIYSVSLCEVTASPERICMIYVAPGRIQWNDYLYSQIEDREEYSLHPIARWRDNRWRSGDASSLTNYDELTDSTSDNLDTALVIEENSPYGQRNIVARWRISCSKGFFLITPHRIVTSVSWAFVGKICDGRNCGSLNGLRSILVQGEGVLGEDQRSSNGMLTGRDPIIRVLTRNPAAVWVALARDRFEAPRVGGIETRHYLQCRQCVRCCVKNALVQSNRGHRKHPFASVCILTSV